MQLALRLSSVISRLLQETQKLPIRAAHVDRGLELEADYFHKAKLDRPEP
ncbi:hypothetical protein Q644_14210 [Brucella intermedia 229E]|uniref:Uncharacterized protein n=1 Tax=Brucella intermedia 229E TaxID=1337887 RepID=U4VF49_9HYPH|nr:hypothetical protein Q644_14210 [Brucella intermedia 229E]